MAKPTGPNNSPSNDTEKVDFPEAAGPESDDIITADYVGKIMIGDIEIGCAVLSNEKRVFFQREILGALTGHRKGAMERYFSAENLKPFLPEKYAGEDWDANILKFKYGGRLSYAYEATDLIDICNMYIQARNAGVLQSSQMNLATRAQIIMTAFAKTGVIAVIDEATGYQIHRKKDALRLLVESYIVEEARKWMKEFPDEFFEALDKIYDNPRSSKTKRPQYYGAFINKYVYAPIENEIVLDKLKELAPRTEKGNRVKRFHSFLNEQKGIQVLRNRIGKITALLQISPNKRKFDTNFARMEGMSRQLDFDDIAGYED